MLVLHFNPGEGSMRSHAVILGAIVLLSPLGAQAADLVEWWEYGYTPEEDAAVRETNAAFEHKTGKQVEVIFYPDPEYPGKLAATVEAGAPTPDFAFGTGNVLHLSKWAIEDRLVDLTDTVGPYADLFDPDALAWWSLLNRKTGQRALYALPTPPYIAKAARRPIHCPGTPLVTTRLSSPRPWC